MPFQLKRAEKDPAEDVEVNAHSSIRPVRAVTGKLGIAGAPRLDEEVLSRIRRAARVVTAAARSIPSSPERVTVPRIWRLLADKGYDVDWLRAHLRLSGVVPVIPGTRSRKRPIRHDKACYKDRWRAEAVFRRLKDFRRVATRYDKLARNYASTVVLAVTVAFWC